MSQIAKVEITPIHGAQEDVIITLKNGRVIHISPEFDAINVWATRADLDKGDFDSAMIIETDMGAKTL